MTLHARNIPEVPEDTVRIAKKAFKKGNRYMQMRDELGSIYEDEQFADLFPNVGQLAQAPWRLALVTLMQFAETLSDRQAAEAVRARIDWKYALSLELDDDGFDYSVLSEFRTRLLAHGAEERLFEQMLAVLAGRGLLKERGKQRTDSTRILGRVRELNRLELVGETVRAALNAVAGVAGEWLQSWVPDEWYRRYNRPFSDYHLPEKATERLALGAQIGQDGYTLMEQIFASATDEVRVLSQVVVLHRVWIEQFLLDGQGQVQWRDNDNLPPGHDTLRSPYDTDVRRNAKRGSEWNGYKTHFTETYDEDLPHLVVHVATTLATVTDNLLVDPIHAALQAHARLPATHTVDTGYISAENLVNSQRDYAVELLGPPRPTQGWQTRMPDAFDLSHFHFDFDHHTATCPQGHTTTNWSPRPTQRQTPDFTVQFPPGLCRACPVRQRCTQSPNGRKVTLPPADHFEALQTARKRQTTPEFRAEYQKRAGIEGTLSRATNAFAMRTTRYLGLPKVHLQNLMTAAALNLVSALDFLAGKAHATTRKSCFARLAPA